MKPTHRSSRAALRLLPLAALFAAGSAMATNGYFAHGYGMKAKGMGGASAALAQDSFGGANNPASMVWAGSRLDLGLDWFSPVRSAERSGAVPTGATFPYTLNGKVDSGSENFFVPEIGYNQMLGSALSVGVSVYGNGGMNTSYPQGDFTCADPVGTPVAANALCGSGSLGVDLTQLIIAPTVAYKLSEQHAFGVSPLLGYQRFKAEGLQAFDSAGASSSPGNVTNRGYDSATGFGLRVGYMGRLNDMVSVGAAYSTKVKMGAFKKYAGLFAGNGDFDIPSNYSVGVAVMPDAAWTIALDYGRINYAGVASVGNASALVAPLGAANGPGFGWANISVVKVGAAWRMNDSLTLRAGYNRGGNPIREADVTFNILAPGVMKEHYTLGFTYSGCKECEITGALMVAPRQSVTGASLFNSPTLFNGAAGSETISMRQTSLGIAWSMKF